MINDVIYANDALPFDMILRVMRARGDEIKSAAKRASRRYGQRGGSAERALRGDDMAR